MAKDQRDVAKIEAVARSFPQYVDMCKTQGLEKHREALELWRHWLFKLASETGGFEIRDK